MCWSCAYTVDMAQTFEIIGQGTDSETLEFGALQYWLDISSDPRNSIGWMVKDGNAHGAQDTCSVAEVAAVPGAREYVLARTRDGIERAIDRANRDGYDAEAVQALKDELDEA
jgi:hypothetical protein